MRVITVPERYSVTVTLPGTPPRAIVIEGRSAKMIAWLVYHRAHLERIGAGALTFNMGLREFRPRIEENFPAQQAAPEPVPGEGPIPEGAL